MRSSTVVLLLLSLLAPASSARAGGVALEAPAQVRAGTRVELHWSGLPPEVREVELELSLDGGRWVRISPELEAGEGHFGWHVPGVMSERARVRLRAGGEDFETGFAVSEEFRIESREATLVPRPGAADWWHLGEQAAAQGLEPGRPHETFSRECAAGAIESTSEARASLSCPTGVSASPAGPRTTSSPLPPGAAWPGRRHYPMRN